jgi:hypothetical protein
MLSSAPPAQAAVDISGAWEVSVTTSRGVEIATLTLTKTADGYTGTVVRGTDHAPAAATVKDMAVTITITAQMSSGPAVFTLKGDVAGDTASGTADLGTRGTGTWTAKRVPAAADASGTWSLEIDTGQGTATPTFILKQDGEKLSGQYKGAFGEAPVTGTIKGNDAVFFVDLTIEGNSARINYTGTIDKDSMKGTVKFGDMGEAAFKGTRKR